MTPIEDRVRSGLRAEGEALARATRTAQSTSRHGSFWSGGGLAVAVAILVLVVFGGVSLITDGGGDVVNQPATPPPTAPSANTSVPSTNAEGSFEAVPFRGATWQFTVSEEINPAGTYDVCFVLNPIGATSEGPSVGSPWCDDWPNSDARISRSLLGVHHGLATDTSYVMVVQLNSQPVDRVTITGDGVDETVAPFALPGSGMQFAVVEVPQSDGTITVSAVDRTGAVLDQQEGLLGRIEPMLIDGTPVDDTTASSIGTMMGGDPLTDEELERITGSAGAAHSGYLIESTMAGAYELGLIVFLEEPMEPMGQPMICFSKYAMTKGVNVGGGAVCADSQERAEELAEFFLGASGACGPNPKEEPVVDGNWLTLAVWGIPETADTLTVELGNGTTVDIEVRSGVALHIWEGRVDITSITFDGMTQNQRDLISSYMPIQGIADDCNPSDGAG